MNQEIVESVQQAITPAECADLYYPGEENTNIQCYSATVENRFVVSLPSLAMGSSSTVVFNPSEGVGDIVLTARLPAPSGSLYTNWRLPRGWLAQFIRQIGIRIGGSSLYYFTGDQLEIANFIDCEDTGKKTALWELAGSELLVAADFNSDANRTASIYIKCPWNTISALQKQLPLNSDLLVQPIQLIIETNRPEDVFFPLATASAANLPRSFDLAQVQFKQVHLSDSSNQLARRVDMNKEALTYPLRYFQQTTFRTQIDAVAGQAVSVNLTGFRQGSLKNMTLWALKVADDQGAPTNVGNGRNYSQILSAVVSVNGLIYYDSRNASSQLWSLCDLKTPATFENTVLADAGSGVASATPVATPYLYVPFAQVSEVLANHNEVVMGLPIQNSVVNLSVVMPETGKYVLSASYNFTASMMFSKGTAEYVF